MLIEAWSDTAGPAVACAFLVQSISVNRRATDTRGPEPRNKDCFFHSAAQHTEPQDELELQTVQGTAKDDEPSSLMRSTSQNLVLQGHCGSGSGTPTMLHVKDLQHDKGFLSLHDGGLACRSCRNLRGNCVVIALHGFC